MLKKCHVYYLGGPLVYLSCSPLQANLRKGRSSVESFRRKTSSQHKMVVQGIWPSPARPLKSTTSLSCPRRPGPLPRPSLSSERPRKAAPPGPTRRAPPRSNALRSRAVGICAGQDAVSDESSLEVLCQFCLDTAEQWSLGSLSITIVGTAFERCKLHDVLKHLPAPGAATGHESG